LLCYDVIGDENMQINRLFQIIYTLLDKKSATAKELAAQHSVSVRTIYRDVETLSSVGIPVYTEQGKGGGISLLPNFVLNKSILNEREQTEILSALQGLSSVKTIETDRVLQRLSTFFNKAVVNWIDVDFSHWGFIAGEFFNGFKTAIISRRVAEFDYYAVYGETAPSFTSRRIEPVQLWFKGKAWYVKGFCLLRQDIRTFKLSRMGNLIITDEYFAERDLTTLIQTPSNPDWEKKNIPLKFKIDQEMAHRVYDEFHESQAEKQPDGSFIVTTSWPEDDWVYGTILSYGEHIEVLEPPHVRALIKEKAEKIAKKHL